MVDSLISEGDRPADGEGRERPRDAAAVTHNNHVQCGYSGGRHGGVTHTCRTHGHGTLERCPCFIE